MRDWPGLRGPLVHAPDPLVASPVVEDLAALIAPRYRVLSASPRPGTPYQVSAIDLLGVITQFGFEAPIVVGEGLGCITALVVAAWYPYAVGSLLFVNSVWGATGDSIETRALRECPPDVDALRRAVRCQLSEVTSADEVAATLP